MEYKSNDTSYNTDAGGGFKKEVYQYNLDGTHCHTYMDLQSAANAINATKKKISNNCLNVNQLLDGYYWCYELVDTYIPNKDKRRKEALQIDLEGTIVAHFKSVAEASRQTGISKTCISRVCRGERLNSGGFLWKYSD